MSHNSPRLNFRLGDIIRAALGLAMVDGGFVIALQIITFLLGYFGANIQISDNQQLVSINKGAFLVSIIGMLNLSVIIYRITGLSRGVKYSPLICYSHALRRWPVLILLYLLGSMCLLFAAVPMVRFLNTLNATLDPQRILTFIVLVLIPFGMLACIYVIDQEHNPLQAVMATWDAIKNRISLRLLLNISLLYALPFSLNDVLLQTKVAPYIGLFNSLWFLFCHALIIVIYAGITMAKNNVDDQKSSKVLLA